MRSLTSLFMSSISPTSSPPTEFTQEDAAEDNGEPGGVVGGVEGVKSEVELVVVESRRTACSEGAGDGKRCGGLEALQFVACALGRRSGSGN